jgi:hypothetical protein
MNRWISKFLALISVFAVLSLATSAVLAQIQGSSNIRKFPPDARRGELIVLSAPDVSIDGKMDRMAPGVRIRDASNALVLSNMLVNTRVVVNYTRDNTGLVQNVWVLNPEEAKLKMPGDSAGFFSNIGSLFGTTSAAPQDDGKTPYNQLPKYKQ